MGSLDPTEQQFCPGSEKPGNGDGVNLHSSASFRRLGDLLLPYGHACRAVPVTDTGRDRSYIILIALGQLEGERGEKIESNTQEEHKQNFPNVFYSMGANGDIVCSGSHYQSLINTLNTA